MALGKGKDPLDDLESQLLRQTSAQPPIYGSSDWRRMVEPPMGGPAPLPPLERDTSMRHDVSNRQLDTKMSMLDAPKPGATPSGGAGSGSTTGGGADLDWRNSLRYGGGPGTLSGFRTDGYGGDTKAANTVKNTFGRLAQRYPNTPQGLQQLMQDPDFRRAFPNARLVPGGAGDKIDFGGVLSDFESGTPVGIVDVGQAFDPANNSGQSWAWMPDDDGGGAMVPTGGAGGGAPRLTGGPVPMPGGGSDVLTDPMALINQQIAGLAGGQESQIQAIIEQLLRQQQPLV